MNGVTAPAWQLAMVQMLWLLRGQRVRFLLLLQTALHNGVLRQAGVILQFRHAALQDFLRDHRKPDSFLVISRQNPG
jgi:hypothetical protein